jgi:hypothetical protein
VNAYDWNTAAPPWNELGPEIAASLRQIAAMPMYELRRLPHFTKLLQPGPPTIADIQRLVCDEFDITRLQMLSHTKDRRIAKARSIAMLLARQITTKSYKVIGKAFNKCEMTTSDTCYNYARRGGDVAETIARLRLQLTAQ